MFWQVVNYVLIAIALVLTYFYIRTVIKQKKRMKGDIRKHTRFTAPAPDQTKGEK